MFSFLFDNYGYYPVSIIDNGFVYKDWYFKLIMVEDDEKRCQQLAEFCQKISNILGNKSVFILKNRQNHYLSYLNNNAYCLLSIPNVTVGTNDMYKLHNAFQGIKSDSYSLKKVVSILEEKYNFVTNIVIPAIRKDQGYYKEYMQLIYYNLGIAENAFQYLADLIEDFDDKMENLTLVHKKECIFDSFNFLNPFDLIVDNAVRDLASLFKGDDLSIMQMESILDYYNLNVKEATYLFGRYLYPNHFFDELIDFYDNKKDISVFLLQEREKISNNRIKLNSIYNLLIEKYKIRPIQWIETTH